MRRFAIYRVRDIAAACLLFAAVCVPLYAPLITTPGLPSEEIVGRWVWFGKALLLSSVCVLAAFLLQLRGREGRKDAWRFGGFSACVSWGIVVCGAAEAVWGLRQLYGLTASGHARYALTGSFFNPGPYAGYLAMALPLCLHLYLRMNGDKRLQCRLACGAAAASGILILCVLPATLSRSAWIAAAAGCGWVAWLHRDRHRWRTLWRRYRKRYMLCGAGMLLLAAAGAAGAFALKPDSALGRLFMWKISVRALMEHPAGCGKGFAFAYGEAQERYFAQGDYAAWEERVAGSPEYAFNEYLSLALTEGVVACAAVLAVAGLCLYMGVRHGRYGVCGALLSLLVFSFSSYPMHFPAFVVAGACLLLACGWGEYVGKPLIAGLCLVVWSGGVMDRWRREEAACRKWVSARMLYHSGAYKAAVKAYAVLYPVLRDRGAFLFEYGHSLHKSSLYEESNRYLSEACWYSSDPMVLNVMGKNCQALHRYAEAEHTYYRAVHRLPGRIYPYYLLAGLYAEPGFRKPDRLREMAEIVCTKAPKVHSTAIEEMRREVRRMVEDITVK